VLIGLAGIMAGQEIPKVDVFGGLSYLRVHSGDTPVNIDLNRSFVAANRNVNLNMGGWDSSITENLSYWFGAELDARGAYGSPNAVSNKIHAFSYGPRLSWRRNPRLVPYFHFLLGAALYNAPSNPSGPSAYSAAVALIPGIGVDFNVNRRLSLKLFQVDYMLTGFYGERQDNLAVSAGLVLHFGSN
jgi:hypothetical protein